MRLLGIDMEEWAAAAAFLTCVGAVIAWVFKMSVKSMIDKLIYQLKNLSDNIVNLNKSSERNRELEMQHYQEHEKHLAKHDVDIEALRERANNNEDDIREIKGENTK